MGITTLEQVEQHVDRFYPYEGLHERARSVIKEILAECNRKQDEKREQPTYSRRPRSLFEVAAESSTYSDFGYHLTDFLHAFAFAKDRGAPLEPFLAAEPPPLAERFAEGKICDAFLAATADYLSRVNAIPTPLWALNEDLRLEEPWFSPPFPGIRMRLLRDTPSAFKDKNIFIFDSALSVA